MARKLFPLQIASSLESQAKAKLVRLHQDIFSCSIRSLETPAWHISDLRRGKRALSGFQGSSKSQQKWVFGFYGGKLSEMPFWNVSCYRLTFWHLSVDQVEPTLVLVPTGSWNSSNLQLYLPHVAGRDVGTMWPEVLEGLHGNVRLWKRTELIARWGQETNNSHPADIRGQVALWIKAKGDALNSLSFSII